MTEPTETAELQAFAKTVEARSLSRAAAELGVPRATIGRRLARLEERLGVRLIRRTTRSLVLTDAGEALHRHARIVLEAVAQAEASVRRTDDVVRGELRVSAPPLSTTGFYTMLTRFAEAHPSVRLQVHTSSRIVDLLRDGFDVAIRASSELAPGLVARVLSRSRLLAVASPAYLAGHGTPRTARDLRKHRLLVGFARGDVPQSHWPHAGGGKVRIEGHFYSNDVAILAAAAADGLGIALLPELLLLPKVREKKLVPVLPGIIETSTTVAVVYPEREFVPPQVRAFVDAVTNWAATDLEIPFGARRRVAATEKTGGRARAGRRAREERRAGEDERRARARRARHSP